MSSLKGRSSLGILAASLYASCKICNIPRTLHEISDVSKIPEKNIGRYYKFLNKTLKIKIQKTSAHNFLGRFCDELNLDYQVHLKSLEILKKAESKGLTIGRNPASSAAASIYMASISCDRHRTQKEVATVAGISDLGLRKVYKKLRAC